MPKEMLINVSEGEECRIALLDDGKLEELYMERTSSTSHVGNIYKGKVTNVEPSIQAAFVDFGLGRNGFLHISDLMPSYFGRKGEDIQESVGKKMARRDRPPIQRCLRRGDEIIVQIIKEGIGTKGPTLSTYLSIPGRILVMMPGMGKMGVSKKIEDEEERKRLRTILDSLKPPKGVGFIIRTAGIGKTKAEIQRDLVYLSRLWMQIEKKRTSGSGPMELYTEGDLVTRTVRDVFAGDVDRLIVDNEAVAKRVKEVIKITAPRTKNKVEEYDEPIPLFHKFGIERDIEMMYSRHVPLPSGGSLVIDSTEAIVAIDVNSGKFRDHSDAEMTAFKTDMEAAEEIPRQLKLRDLGGVIICDFIDLRYERHRRELEEKLHENFKKDRAKTKVLRMSQFGIIEITRQRMRPSLKRSIYFDCPHCKGAGLVKTPESMSLDVMRRLAIAAHHEKVSRVELSVCPDVSFYLLNKKRLSLGALEKETGKKIVVRMDQTLGLDEMKLDLFDSRDGMVFIEELGLATNQPPHTTQLGTRPHGAGRGRDRGRGGRGGRGGRDERGGGRQPQGGGHEERFEREEAGEEDHEEHGERVEARRELPPPDPALVAKFAPTIVEERPASDRAADAPTPADDLDADDELHDDEEDNGNVVDVEDGHSSLGERPEGEWERRGYGGGGGGGRGGQGRGGQGRGGQNRGGQNRGGQGGGHGGHGGQGRHDQGGGPPRVEQVGGPAQVDPVDGPVHVGPEGGVPGGGPEQGGEGGGRRRRRRRGRRGRGGGGGGGNGAPGIQQGPQVGGQQQNRPPQQPQNQNRGGGQGGGGGRGDDRNRPRHQQGGQGQRYGGPPHQQRRPNQPVPPAAAMANYADDTDYEALDVPAPGNERLPEHDDDGGVPPRSGPGGGGGGGQGGQGQGGKRRRRRGGRRHRRNREGGGNQPVRTVTGDLSGLPTGDDVEYGIYPEDEERNQTPQAQPAGGGAAQADDRDDVDEDADVDRDAEQPVSRERAAEREDEAEDDVEAEAEAPAEEEAEAEDEPAAKAKPAAKKKRATTTSRAKKPAAGAAKKKSTSSARRATPKRTPPKKSASSGSSSSGAAIADTPVVKTGSADKHLADDEPVDTPAPRRARKSYDLDEIPDDYD